MDPALFLKALIIGFSIAAPVGPIGVLCIRRTLAQGRATGLATGLGAAGADAVYGAIAALGITAVTTLLVEQAHWLRLFGGAFLIWLGIQAMREAPADAANSPQAASLAAAFGSTFLLTLANPMTILSFVAVFASLGPSAGAPTRASVTIMIFGVFLGSALWWLGLSAAVGWLRERMNATTLQWVNRLSGGIIIGFGLWSILGLAL